MCIGTRRDIYPQTALANAITPNRSYQLGLSQQVLWTRELEVLLEGDAHPTGGCISTACLGLSIFSQAPIPAPRRVSSCPMMVIVIRVTMGSPLV